MSERRRPLRRPGVLTSLLVLGCTLLPWAAALAQPMRLADPAGTVAIVTGPSPSVQEQFASGELARYLSLMTGAKFTVSTTARTGSPELVVGRRAVEAIAPKALRSNLGDDGFILRRQGNQVLIAGLSARGTLYAVYAMLEKLGCRWFAPNYDYYGAAKGETIPHIASPAIDELDDVERPAFPWRKLYIEEGRSHNAHNLVQMVDWMAKARMNVLDCPADYQHQGRTKWDNWRKVLIPELRKRGLLIEVGGHGYQTYLPPETYFAKHPQWFGMHDGQRSSEDFEVFATSNPEAVHMLVVNISKYLAAHPEINIFDLWPPDGARWSEAKADVALGNPTERQILLLNQVAHQLRLRFPHVRIQFIAYQTYTQPPLKHKPAPGILMEFCPINRSFESALYEGATAQNEEYFRDLQGWSDGVIDPASITIYSYITKYAWRSLPVIVPHLIVDEARRYREMGLGGMATYSEPGNWATFELDHYIVARALWKPDIDVARVLDDYADRRYGPAGKFVRKYLRLLEQVVPHAVAIPGTQLDEAREKTLLDYFAPAPQLLAKAHAAAADDPAVLILLAKLDHQYQYVSNEMAMQLLLLGEESHRPSMRFADLEKLLQERKKILAADHGDGVILQSVRVH